MKTINLRDKAVAILDDDDYKRLAGFTWRALEVNGKVYAVTSTGINAKDNLYMQRAVMNETGRVHITHLNHNTLDNRKENLGYRKKSKDKKRF